MGGRYLEMIVAPDALNRLVAYLSDSSTGANMNFLLCFTVLAFHRNHDIALAARHRCFSSHRIMTRTARRVLLS